jgi:hypothetical protein
MLILVNKRYFYCSKDSFLHITDIEYDFLLKMIIDDAILNQNDHILLILSFPPTSKSFTIFLNSS